MTRRGPARTTAYCLSGQAAAECPALSAQGRDAFGPEAAVRTSASDPWTDWQIA